ncbi:MAG: efflux RND transporter periplasmic adaptor subunit, partial [Cyanobacteria bacterium]|nr:efflux RND transporter periplasmic adaptor subunit [Cyanobacteriota bacterium]
MRRNSKPTMCGAAETASSPGRNNGRVCLHFLNRLAMLSMVVSLVLACLSSCGAKEEKAEPAKAKAVPVKLKTITAGNVSSTVTLIGAMDSRESVDLFPRIDGYVAKIPITPGMLVKQG